MKTDMNVVYEDLSRMQGKRINNYTIVSHGNGLYSVFNHSAEEVTILRAKDEYEAMKRVLKI